MTFDLLSWVGRPFVRQELDGSSPLKSKLVDVHPRYEELAQAPYWPTMRAFMEGLNTDELKRLQLVCGEFEKSAHFDRRTALTQYLGVLQSIMARMCGAVFEGVVQDIDEERDAELLDWAANVDGHGTNLQSFLEEYAQEALGMGAVGFLVDKPARDPERPRPQDKATEEALGLRRPFIVPFMAESILDHDEDRHGLLWVKLAHIVREKAGPLESRGHDVEFLVIDREMIQRWRAKIRTNVQLDARSVAAGAPRMIQTTDIEEPEEYGPPVMHETGIVPFVPLCGGANGLGKITLPLLPTVRADKAGLNEDSSTTWSRYLHNVPLFWAKLARTNSLARLIKDPSAGFHLDPDENEEVGYTTTPSESFETGMRAVETRRLEGYRQAGADPIGLFEDGPTPESGRAKRFRHHSTEAKILCAFARRLRDAHQDLLEVVARRLAPTAPPPGVRVFQGSVKYPEHFDLDADETLVDTYTVVGRKIRSAEFHRAVLKRIARILLGNVSDQLLSTIDEDIDKTPEDQLYEQGQGLIQRIGTDDDIDPDEDQE